MEIKFALDQSARSKDINGYLHISSSHITKARVSPYYGNEIPGWKELNLLPDKIYYGLRDPQELKDSLPTWSGLPLHIDHHIDSAQDPQTLTRVGSTGTNIVWNDPYVDAPLVIWDQTAIDLIEDNTYREISCAYRYTPDFTAGFYNGERYDFIMRNIRGNHVALVEEGRVGPDVLVADSNININSHCEVNNIMPDNEEKKDVAETTQETPNFKEAMDNCGLDADNEEQAKAFAAGVAYGVEHAEAEEEKAESAEDEEEEKADSAKDSDSVSQIIEALPELSEEQIAKIKTILCAAEETTNDEDEKAEDEDEKAQDEDEESEGASDRALKKRKKASKVAMDANKIRSQAIKETMQRIKGISVAVQKVKPLIGELDPLVFDSAASVYKEALKQMGINPKLYKPSAWRGMIDVYLREHVNRQKIDGSYAKDSKPIPTKGPFSHLANITLSM